MENNSPSLDEDRKTQGSPLKVGLDLETECAVADCDDNHCKHALNPYTARITIIGIVYRMAGGFYRATVRTVPQLEYVLGALGCDWVLIGQNLKFDLKMLRHAGFHYRPSMWGGDSLLAASACLDKVDPKYLRRYEAERQRRNKQLPRGYTHRAARPSSLKVMAPYYLGVEAFWEDPSDHDNEEYVLKDTEYCLRLEEFFCDMLKKQGLYDFYVDRLLRWTKMLLEAEIKGIQVDRQALEIRHAKSIENAARLRHELDMEWASAYCSFREVQIKEIVADSVARCAAYTTKLKDQSYESLYKTQERYRVACDKKIEAVPVMMNLDSPTQLAWLLKEHFNLDIKDFDDEESTGKGVLQRLAASGRKDISLFLDYRSEQKLATAFFPTYKDLCTKANTLHTSFNSTGTRTGRLSSSGPNLQQVPGHLHSLFIARPGMKLITRDMSAIEPCVVAYYTEDPLLCGLIMEGRSFHAQNVRIMMGIDESDAFIKAHFPKEYKLAKQCGLALMYGAGPTRIQATAQQVGMMWTEEKCSDIYENYLDAYKDVFAFKRDLDRMLWDGKAIPNLLGRKHSYPNKRDIHMKGFNTLVQSTASDLLLESTERASQELKEENLDAYPLLWVHDEAIFEAAEDDVVAAERIIERAITQHRLPTRHGNIPLKCEGQTAHAWCK